MQARLPQDFIGIGIANTGHELAARQHTLDLAAERLQARTELFQRDIERLRAHARIIGHRLEVVGEIELAHLFLVDVAQLPAISESEFDVRARHALIGRSRQLQAPGELGVEHQE